MKLKINAPKSEKKLDLNKETVKDLAVKTDLRAGLRGSAATSDSVNACCC
jgi:hypothetical protein